MAYVSPSFSDGAASRLGVAKFGRMNDRSDEAAVILRKLHSNPSDPDDEFARVEHYQIQQQIAIDRTLESTWISLFKKPSYRKRVILATSLPAIVASSGVLVIASYSALLYSNLGYGPEEQLLFTGGYQTLAVVCNLVAMVFVDKYPRNKYVATGLFGCVTILTIECALIATELNSGNKAAQRAAVAVLFAFNLAYGPFLDGTIYSYMGEMFPNHLRAKGMSLGVAAFALTNLTWLQAAPTAFA